MKRWQNKELLSPVLVPGVSIANKLVDRVISILGVPMESQSDQGSKFESQVLKENQNDKLKATK